MFIGGVSILGGRGGVIGAIIGTLTVNFLNTGLVFNVTPAFLVQLYLGILLVILAAQVGGIGMAPGGNIGDGVAVFEATHGSAEPFAGKNRVNPGSIILSGEMMLRYLGWTEAADLVLKGVKGAIRNKQLTYDLARARAGKRLIRVKNKDKSSPVDVKQEITKLVPGATLVSTSGFGDAVINNL